MLVSLALATCLQQAPPEAASGRPAWDDFPVFVWRLRHRGAPLPDELRLFGGTNIRGNEEAGWLAASDLSFYIGWAAGRDDLHLDVDDDWNEQLEAWYESRDEALLVRDPCLTDPDTVARLFSTLEESLAMDRPWERCLGISLGDEVGLTPYGNPFDLCRSETCEAAWRDYARENGWPARAPTTDDVRLALGDDDLSLVGPWLARRRFHHDVVRELLEALAKRARELRPGTPVGLLGLGSQTAFGGIDVRRAARVLDFLECYPTGETRELFHTSTMIPNPGRATNYSVQTLFADQETPDGLAWTAWDHWMRRGDALVLWSDAALEDSTPHRERLDAALTMIRFLDDVHEPISFGEYPYGAAIVRDADSVAAGWLRDALLDGPTWPRRLAGYQAKSGTRERKVLAWLRLLEDAGVMPGTVDLESEWLSRFRVLVLPEVLVLAPEELDALKEYLDQGGQIVIDGELGWIDRRGKRWIQDPVGILERHAPERVHQAPRSVATYLSNRLDIERARGIRARVLELLVKPEQDSSGHALKDALIGEAVVGRYPWEGRLCTWRGDAARIPWLTASRSATVDAHELIPVSWRVVALPNYPTREERSAHLRDVELSLEPRDGYAIRWLHPLPEEPGDAPVLPAGDAAVFVIEKTGD